uniref:Centromere protein S n=1 Tax=Trichuris muris TaxID=70415 RepID=A0A5S6Q8N0_TRIMR
MADCLDSVLDTWTTDLLAFARHAKRTMVTCDDVRLLCRRNPSLLQHLDSRFPTKTEPNKRSRCNSMSNQKSAADPTIEMSDYVN